MSFSIRVSIAIAALCLVCAGGCSNKPVEPLKELHPVPSTFSLELKTMEMVDSMGLLEENEVNENVVPAREAIEYMESKGYTYTPDGGRWRIRIDLICYDPAIVKRVHEEEQMAGIFAPVYWGDLLGPVGEGWETASIDQGWIQVTHSAQGMTCGAKARLSVTDTDEVTDDNTFVGEGFAGPCAYNNGCAYDQCAQNLSRALPKLLGKVFK